MPNHTMSHLPNHSNMPYTKQTDVLIIGAGASGLYCALTAGKRGRRVMVIDHANKAGKKILMSGGGRCNFTNYFVSEEHFLSHNAHFCKSALSRYPSWNFISLVEKHQIAYQEKEHGQLFCVHSSRDILDMLLAECAQAQVSIHLKTQVLDIQALKDKDKDTSANFLVTVHDDHHDYQILTHSLVVATGGLSIPTMGASGFGYQVAQQFGHEIINTSAGLVPFILTGTLKEQLQALSGISHEVIAFNERVSFHLPMLFTHRGLSGPAMLQLSNYWQVGEFIHINLLPNLTACDWLITQKTKHPKQLLKTALSSFFPKKLLLCLQALFWADVAESELANIKDERLVLLGNQLNDWKIKPAGTEGYRTAEVTKGGVDTKHISSKTFESQLQNHLYFIGEVLDVTGWLGGYNFQWAWASGHACGHVV